MPWEIRTKFDMLEGEIIKTIKNATKKSCHNCGVVFKEGFLHNKVCHICYTGYISERLHFIHEKKS